MANDRFSRRQGFDVQLPNVPVRAVRWALIAVVLAVLIFSSVYTVEPEEIAVVLRFGAFDPDRVGGPGLHFKLPLGIDEVIKVPIERQLKHEFGFRTTGLSEDRRSEYSRVGDESEMLTGDLNAAVVEWVVQYRIQDPEKYLFRVKGVEDTFRHMSEAVMRRVVGDRTVNEVLTIGRSEVANLVGVELQELADQYETGLVVDQVVLQDVNPPDRVKPSFNEVNQAQQEREQKINVAQKEFNEAVPRAAGEADQVIQQAEGYAIDRTNRAEGEATRFSALYAEYRKAPEVTRKRLYLETLAQILPAAGEKVVVDEEVRGLLPLFNLDRAGRQNPGQSAAQGDG